MRAITDDIAHVGCREWIERAAEKGFMWKDGSCTDRQVEALAAIYAPTAFADHLDGFCGVAIFSPASHLCSASQIDDKLGQSLPFNRMPLNVKSL